MSRLPSVTLLVAVLLLAPSLLSAQAEPVVDPAPDPAAAAGLAAAAPPPPPVVLSPLMQEITAAWKAHEVVVAALEQELAATADATAALALQRQIESARAQVEVEILTIQARHARRNGRADVAAELEAAIGQLSAAPARGIPVPRARETD
jgi:hypothetical protein